MRHWSGHIYRGLLLSTASLIIFWDFSMFYQIFLSPQVRRWAIISCKHGIYELPQQLVRELVDTMIISNNRPSLHFWWKENLVKHQKVSKYYETDCKLHQGVLLKMRINTGSLISLSFKLGYNDFFSLSMKYFIILNTAWKVSVFWVMLIRISPHTNWIRRDTEYFKCAGEHPLRSENTWRAASEVNKFPRLFW